MLTGSESMADFREITNAEKTALEASDAAWNAVPAQPPHEDNDTRTTGGERA